MASEVFAQTANHLWQSTIFALTAPLLTLAFRKNRTKIGYALWLAASLKFLVDSQVSINHPISLRSRSH